MNDLDYGLIVVIALAASPWIYLIWALSAWAREEEEEDMKYGEGGTRPR